MIILRNMHCSSWKLVPNVIIIFKLLSIEIPRPLPWVVYILKLCLRIIQWWWNPILWDLEFKDCWIYRLLNHNTIPSRIIHNCILLLIVSILYLL